jgi:hypothetical protein
MCFAVIDKYAGTKTVEKRFVANLTATALVLKGVARSYLRCARVDSKKNTTDFRC